MNFNKIEELISDVRVGKMVLLVDDEDRENEGDLVMAADHITSEQINFMAKEARGLICLSLPPEQVERLKLPMMIRDEQNLSPNKTAFTVSIEAAYGVSTGISAADRAHTIKVASNPEAKASDIIMPGHVFPIKAQPGGVLKRAGHTEGSLDLARLAGLRPAAVICEVMNEDGTMARVPDLIRFAEKHQIKIGTIVDLIEYRLAHESLVEEVGVLSLPILGDEYKAKVFRSRLDQVEHLVIQKGELQRGAPTLVRVHVEDSIKDFLKSLQKSLHPLNQVLQMMESENSAVLLILRGTSKKQSLLQEIEQILDGQDVGSTMDDRDYGLGAQILRSLGLGKIKLITSKPDRKVGIKAYGIEIVDYISNENEERDKSEKQKENSKEKN